MPIIGHVKNGVVVPDDEFDLPDDTEVWLLPAPAVRETGEARSQELLMEMRRIAALPLNEIDAPFCGADHDKVLYGAS